MKRLNMIDLNETSLNLFILSIGNYETLNPDYQCDTYLYYCTINIFNTQHTIFLPHTHTILSHPLAYTHIHTRTLSISHSRTLSLLPTHKTYKVKFNKMKVLDDDQNLLLNRQKKREIVSERIFTFIFLLKSLLDHFTLSLQYDMIIIVMVLIVTYYHTNLHYFLSYEHVI